MNPSPDLHSHSTASDGTLTPTQLVQRAATGGVRLLALTDHDTTAGLAEAAAAARRLPLSLVPGVEISVTWGGRTVHIVGLRIDPAHPVLRQGLDRLVEFRTWRAEEMGRRLERHGIDQAFEGAKALSNGTLIGRTHFARFLVAVGKGRDTRDIFKRFLTNGNPGYVAGDWASLEDAVGWIRQAGGQAVIAHPGRYKLTRTRLLKLFGEFRELGGVALEVVTGSHSRDDVFNFARHAREQSLLASAGSDYHGPESPWLDLGKLPPLPDSCRPIWHDWPEMAEPEPELKAAVG